MTQPVLEPIEWKGDLGDDCTAEWRGMFAHAECLYEYDPDDHEPDESPNDPSYWFCSVIIKGREYELFHDMTADVMPKTGKAARWLCELVMRAYAAGVYPELE